MSMFAKAIGARAYTVGILCISLVPSSVKGYQRSSFCEASTVASLSPETSPNAYNPLLIKNSLPKFAEITSSHVKPALETDLTYLKENFSLFENKLQKKDSVFDFNTVVDELEVIQAPLSYSWGVVGHLMSVKNSDELRKSHDAMQPSIVEVYQNIGQSQQVFKALIAIKNNSVIWNSLDEAQQRIINSSIRSMENSGVGLDPIQREKFNALKLEAAELSTKFSNNVLDSTKAFKLKITDSRDIEGLPDSAKALAAQQAVRNGDENATKENGPWLLTLDMPSYLPSMQHLKSRSIREQLYRAYVTRASKDDQDNAPIIKRILQIKKETSGMLGYKCYAEQSLDSKMAPSIEKVLELINMLRDKSYNAAKQDIQDLRNFAKAEGFNEELNLWDIPYWSERLREKQYEFEEEALRPYFALPSVLDGMFKLANRLFGITIEAADGEAEVWNPDVRFFNIKDSKTGKYLASFYLDAYSRPSEKRGGAWMDVCIQKSKVLNRKPVAYLTCNGTPPVGNQPSLMTFGEVETLFHEFGHGLQHMLTTVEHSDAAGINNVEWDAVELPSQFMENWCYDKKTLYGFAKHYSTGEPLPEELFEKVKMAKNFQSGLAMLRQLFFGALDMELHSEKFNPYGEKSVFEIQHELATKYTVIPPLPEDRFLCSFSHIFAGGYSAGYYSYKWAEVMSADAFGAFEEVGLENEAKVQETGRRFRDTVLSLGGGKHPSEVFKLFRGREPSTEALLRHSNLVK